MNPNGSRDRQFRVPISDKAVVNIKIHMPALRAQGLDLTAWPSSYVLAGLLHKLDIELPAINTSNIPILELGAGIGLVGLVASVLWHRRAFLTDLEPIVPGLALNIDLNSELLAKHGGAAIAGELDWDNPQKLITHAQSTESLDADLNKADIILAADTIYSEDHPEILAQTILKWLAPGPRSRVVLTYPLRVAHLEQFREIWSLLESGGLEAVDEGRKEADELGSDSWDDEKLCEWCVWKWKQSTNILDEDWVQVEDEMVHQPTQRL